jgi:glycine oxidase
MSLHASTYDCVLIGGGVIGLSLAYELSRNGLKVCVLERGEPGREASWAGAGILPPGADSPQAHPLEQLIASSSKLHRQWAIRLREETGLDTGYRPCGGLYLACRESETADLRRQARRLVQMGVSVTWLSGSDIRGLEPALRGAIDSGFLLPDEAQLRNPRHLQALLAACRSYGVEILSDTPCESLHIRNGRIESIQTLRGNASAAEFCLTAGCWTSALSRQLGYRAEVKPVRGQIALLASRDRPLSRVINHGFCYLVPREDGRVLVGSTMEDAGFDASTTAEAIDGLLRFAMDLAPELAKAAVERTWAGLRPATADGLPLLGRVPDLKNAWIATGHFRNGLTLSTATAQEMSLLIRGHAPTIDLGPYCPARFHEPRRDDGRHLRRPLATHGV